MRDSIQQRIGTNQLQTDQADVIGVIYDEQYLEEIVRRYNSFEEITEEQRELLECLDREGIEDQVELQELINAKASMEKQLDDIRENHAWVLDELERLRNQVQQDTEVFTELTELITNMGSLSVAK